MGRSRELWYDHSYINYYFNLIITINRKKFLSIMHVDALWQTDYSIRQLVNNPPCDPYDVRDSDEHLCPYWDGTGACSCHTCCQKCRGSRLYSRLDIKSSDVTVSISYSILFNIEPASVMVFISYRRWSYARRPLTFPSTFDSLPPPIWLAYFRSIYFCRRAPSSSQHRQASTSVATEGDRRVPEETRRFQSIMRAWLSQISIR